METKIPEQQNFPVPTPHKIHQIWPTVLVLVIIAAAVFAAVYFNSKRKVQPTNPQQSIQAPTNATSTVNRQLGEKIIISGLEKIKIPPVASQSPVATTDLPKELTDLMPSEATGSTVSVARFTDGKSGFVISYSSSESIQNAATDLSAAFYSAFLSQPSDSYGSSFGIVEASTLKYEARADISLNSSQEVMVLITVYVK